MQRAGRFNKWAGWKRGNLHQRYLYWKYSSKERSNAWNFIQRPIFLKGKHVQGLALKRAMVATTETWSTLTVNMFLKRETVARATTKRLVLFHTLFYGIMLANFESEDVQIQRWFKVMSSFYFTQILEIPACATVFAVDSSHVSM